MIQEMLSKGEFDKKNSLACPFFRRAPWGIIKIATEEREERETGRKKNTNDRGSSDEPGRLPHS